MDLNEFAVQKIRKSLKELGLKYQKFCLKEVWTQSTNIAEEDSMFTIIKENGV